MRTDKLTFIVLLINIVMLAVVCVEQAFRLHNAKLYIQEFETTYPDYIDTVSGSDAYDAWY